MTGISQATIRQFLTAAAIALALGNDAAQAVGGGDAETPVTASGERRSTLALAQKAGSGRQLPITRGSEVRPADARPAAGPPGGVQKA